MPTGYTSSVADGSVTTLREFAMLCARGMGACIMMRDEPWGAPIPERFEPSTYNAEKLEAARAERQRLYDMSDAEADAAAQAEYRAKLAAKEKWQAEQVEQRNRYNAMLAQVVPWQRAPEGLKEFMLDQLHRGRDFDCPDNATYWDEPQLMTGAEWRGAKLVKAERDVLYHAEEDAKERARTESRNAWIAQLRASLASVDRSPKGGDACGSIEDESAIGDSRDATPPPPHSESIND